MSKSNRSWVTVPPALLAAGRIPAVSVLSGQPADTIVEHKVPPANEAALAALGGLLLVGIVRLFRNSGLQRLRVPLTVAEAASVRTRRVIRIVLSVLGVGAVLAGYLLLPGSLGDRSDEANVGMAVIGLGAVILLATFFVRSPIVARTFDHQVQIKAVPAFAAAIQTTSAASAYSVYTPSTPPPAALPAGWYPDPSGSFARRWWNGTGWTGDVVDAAGQQHRADG